MHSHKVGTVTTRTSCVAGHGILMDGQCGGGSFQKCKGMFDISDKEVLSIGG